MSLDTPTKRVTAEADSIIKGKSTVLLSFQWKLYVVRSLVLSTSTNVMKLEGTDHKKKGKIICDFNGLKSNIVRKVPNNTAFYFYSHLRVL